MKYLLATLLLSSVLVFQACSKVGPSVADSENLSSQAVTALALDDAYMKGGSSLVLSDEAAALINSGAFDCARGTEDDSSSEDGLPSVASKGSGSSSHDSESKDSESKESSSHDSASQDSASQDTASSDTDSQDSASEDKKCDRNKKVKVCHRTPDKDITLCVSIKSLKAHLNHGGQRCGRQDGSGEELKDFLGDCTAVPPGSNPTTTTQAPPAPTTTQAAPTTTQAPPAPTTTTTTTTLPFDPGQF